MDNVTTQYIDTKEGHKLQVFYNRDRRLLVVDVIHKDGNGGNELVRRTLDFPALLNHCKAYAE